MAYLRTHVGNNWEGGGGGGIFKLSFLLRLAGPNIELFDIVSFMQNIVAQFWTLNKLNLDIVEQIEYALQR